MAAIAALLIFSGVLKSGYPWLRLTTSIPSVIISLAFPPIASVGEETILSTLFANIFYHSFFKIVV
ncbi:hypothetical protein [Leuconostoc gelidum]|uniref:hypothetical protein n=1 Tax=Leuconostoc gelidum TaxID=1244 RepID=UPI002F95A844